MGVTTIKSQLVRASPFHPFIKPVYGQWHGNRNVFPEASLGHGMNLRNDALYVNPVTSIHYKADCQQSVPACCPRYV